MLLTVLINMINKLKWKLFNLPAGSSGLWGWLEYKKQCAGWVPCL